MIVPDVNVLVAAWNPVVASHADARTWLQGVISGPHDLGLSELVLSGTVRVLTMPRVPQLSHPLASVLDRVAALLSAPGVVRLRPASRHWRIFRELCEVTGAVGNEVPDCYHAALAIERGATWASRDRFFAGVPGLDWVRPF